MNEHVSTSLFNTSSFFVKTWMSCHAYRHQQFKQQYQQVSCKIQQENLFSDYTNKIKWWTVNVTKLFWYYLLYSSQKFQIKISHKNTAQYHDQKEAEAADIYWETHVFMTDQSIFR